MKNLKSYISINLMAITGWISLLLWITFYLHSFLLNERIASDPSYADGIGWGIVFGIFTNSAVSVFFVLCSLIEYVLKQSSMSKPSSITTISKVVNSKIYNILFYLGVALSLFPIMLILYMLLS